MASAVFPAPVTSSINADSLSAPAANTLYAAAVSLDPAIYTVTCTNTTVATIGFYSDETTLIIESTTVSGTVTFNLATAATKVKYQTDTGTDIVITITKTAAAVISDTISTTLDTITSSGTYTGTSTSGYALVGIVGAGGGGGSGSAGGATYGGGSGGSGGVRVAIAALTGSVSVTIGTGGNAGATNSAGSGVSGNAGNATSFGNLTANGGGGGLGGRLASNNAGGLGGAGGTPGGTAGAPGTQNESKVGGVPVMKWTALAANPIGNGGSVAAYNESPTAGTGYGAGGPASLGSSANDPTSGRAGRPGVIYVLKY